MSRYALAVIGQNVVIDCGSHEEAMAAIDRVSVAPDSPVDAWRGVAAIVQNGCDQHDQPWAFCDEAEIITVLRNALGRRQ